MSKIFRFSNAGIYIAAIFLSILLFAVMFYLGVDKGRFDRAPYNHTQHYSEYTDAEIGNICGASTTKQKAIECAIKNKTKHRNAKREEFELAAQQEMARWAFWVVVMSTFTLVVTTIGIWYVKATLASTKRAIKVTRKIGKEQTMAYLHVDSAKLFWGQEINDSTNLDGTSPRIHLSILNSGTTPAKWFEISGVANAVEYGKTFSSIGDAGFDKAGNFVRWSSVSGGSSVTASLPIEMNKEAVQKALKCRKTHYLSVIGEVRYMTFYGEIFRSEFCFHAFEIRSYRSKKIVSSERGVALEDDGFIKFAARQSKKIVENIKVEKPIKMAKSSIPLRVYERIRKSA